MKFLVVGKGKVNPPQLKDYLSAQKGAKAYIEEALKSGKFDCAYQFADGSGGMAIANFDTAEELWESLMNYPLHRGFDWKVVPLADILWVGEWMIEHLSKHA